jgi:hypothetical protein
MVLPGRVYRIDRTNSVRFRDWSDDGDGHKYRIQERIAFSTEWETLKGANRTLKRDV